MSRGYVLLGNRLLSKVCSSGGRGAASRLGTCSMQPSYDLRSIRSAIAPQPQVLHTSYDVFPIDLRQVAKAETQQGGLTLACGRDAPRSLREDEAVDDTDWFVRLDGCDACLVAMEKSAASRKPERRRTQARDDSQRKNSRVLRGRLIALITTYVSNSGNAT